MKNLATLVTSIALLLYYGSTNAQPLFAHAGGDTTICNGQPAYLGGFPTATGGTPPYLYAWSNGAAAEANPIVSPSSTTTYTVTVTDHAGATATGSDVVTVVPDPAFTITASHDTANYFRQDTLTATLTGGGSATFQWGVNGTIVSGNPTGTGSYLIYNYPGVFEAIASNGYCADTNVFYIQARLSPSISSQTNTRCSYTSDGAININVVGGTGNYTYKWSNGGSAQNLTGLSAGFYSLTVYDNLGNVGYISTTITSPPPLQVNIISDSVGGFPDTLRVSASGGTPPYAYNWINGATTSADIISASGTYTCTVTDDFGCSATGQSPIIGIEAINDSFRVAENATSALNVTKNDLRQNNYYQFPIVTGVTQPVHGASSYNSAVAFYTPSNNYIGNDSFTYSVCLEDSSFGAPTVTSFCDTATAYITVIDSVVIHVQVQPTTCVNTCNGGINLQVSGGVGPYTFHWTDSTGLHSSSSQNLSNLCNGALYFVTVTDANHYSGTASATVTSLGPYLSMYAYADTVVAQVSGSFGVCIFNWSTGAADTSNYGYSSISIPQSGFYCVTVTDTGSSCVITDCDSVGCIGCVWPGDANDDGIVDNNDLLPIGLAYGATGPVRPNASLNWVGQPCTDWTDTLLTGTNYKFIDCNGSGTIDANDTLAIHLNFGNIHLKSGEVRSWRSGQPALYVNLTPDTLINGETVTATFTLGSGALPADNVYGIAFTYNYDPKVVESNKTQVSFGDSWVGNSNNKISLAKDLNGSGQIECALTRINHSTISGYGPIGMATFVITTDNINGLNLANYNMQTWISNLTVIDNLGNHLQFNEGGDTVIVQYTPSGIQEINLDAEIRVFPNPAHEQLIIQSQNQLAMQQITLINLLGETVITQPVVQPYKTTIDISSLSSGAYFVQVKTAGGTTMKRFVVSR